MKLFFKTIVLISLSCFAWTKEQVVIYHQHNNPSALLLKKILTETFSFPENLISIYEQESPCETNLNSVLQLCLNEDGELEIKNMDEYILKNHFKSFIKAGK